MHPLRLAALISLVVTGRAAAQPERPSRPSPPNGADAPAVGPRPRELALRFDWPRSLVARVTYRRVATRTGSPQRIFTARYTERAAHAGGEIRIATSGTRWEGEIPYPPDEVRSATRASEAVVQRVGANGAFVGLENEDALRPILQRIYAAAGLSDEETDQTIARVEAAMIEEARTGWNLAVGFWIGAELDFGRAWESEVDAPVWLLPTLAVKSRVRMEARRRVPCTASERRALCVELTLHSEPDRAGLAALTRAIVAKLDGTEGSLPLGAVREVGLATDLVLVTEPATLVPYRVVWRRAVRATVAHEEEGARELEDVERTEWSWSYARRGPPAR
ncbi:MAG TPA: hypothetical protein VLT61_05920 [Anaeromyxobacteraceae bacterium]|nr:hypothetical protein [Anaeromyxobacteraceae bacterium]